jgi:PRTRC genetic system ThiF family protein
VEPKNVGRQLFSAGDVGRPKARVLAERLAAAFNMPVASSVRRIDQRDTFIRPDALSVVVGAVDNAAARAAISAATYLAMGKLWWLDTGNENHSGQACLGNTDHAALMAGAVALGMTDRLPAPNMLYPDLVNVSKPPKASKNGHRKNGRDPSCAELAAAGEQGLMVNRMAAAWALGLLHDFLLGELHYFGVAFSLQHGSVRTWPLDLPTLSEATGVTSAQLQGKGSN